VPLDYSRIVYSAVLGFLVFGEVPDRWSLVGMALIFAASLYLVLTDKKRGKAKAA
jgi:drug/metabolite transporter (DMT)-like permease